MHNYLKAYSCYSLTRRKICDLPVTRIVFTIVLLTRK